MARLKMQQSFLLAHLAFLLVRNSTEVDPPPSKDHPALFNLGDSLFDAGNNNYINTTTALQANFQPYGEIFFRHPTGRFSDGRLISDFIAEYAKLPLLPPYKQPGNHQFTYGVNFASAGAGALSETFQGMVISLKMQRANFNKVKKMLEQKLGEEGAKKLFSRAIYLFSIGSNDYFSTFLTNSTSVFQIYCKSQYVGMVTGNSTTLLKDIYKTGGRKFGFVNLGPLGCYPLARAMNLGNTGECLEELTTLVKLPNFNLPKVLKKLERRLQGFKYSIFDLYTSVSERMNSPSKYGFEEGKIVCCRSGPYMGLLSCGGTRGIKEYKLCSNPSQYVFFDGGHGTEIAHRQLAKLMWEGAPDVVKPCNLKALF
ncbi:hypothetical protein NMG60_11004000 [Bertholletia excelsa]